MFEDSVEDATTPITLSPILPYPITIASIEVAKKDVVKKGDKLLMFKYWVFQDVIISADGDQIETKKQRVDQVGSFESPYSGVITEINLNVGDELINNKAVIMKIKQDCLHQMVYGGLCVVCGKSVEDNENDNQDRGQSQQQQQQQQQQQNQIRQTGLQQNGSSQVIMSHTNTNIKVSAREARNIANKHMKGLLKQEKLILVVDLDQTVIHCGVDPTIGEWIKDPENPNYDILQEVKSFALEEDISSWLKSQPFFVQQQFHAPLQKSKNWYYVKTRPGLTEFFTEISQYFELHIYTMATRAYALEIAKIIDPDGSLFGDRILSRDENGSLTHKSLERLFPTDQNMVLVIDDRGDVWKWCDNLIKVVPYNFFIGIGDINSTFLPKQDMTLLPESLQKEDVQMISNDVHEKEISTIDEIETEDKHSVQIETQLERRPLKEVSKHFAKGVKLLTDNDIELKMLGPRLVDIHHNFYETYKKDSKKKVDVRVFMNKMRNLVFQNTEIVFSGIIPLHSNFDKVDIVQWSRSFGAQVCPDLTRTTTHLITKTPGTFKARLAKKFNPRIKIVHPDWLFECFLNWKPIPCDKYILKVHGPEVTNLEFENFLESLELRETQELEQKQQQQREETGIEEMHYLGGDDESWLDNDDDEIDELLNSDDEEEDQDEKDDVEQVEILSENNGHGNKRTLEDFESESENNKKQKTGEIDGNAPVGEDEDDEDEDSDLEAQLLQELSD